MGMLEIFALQSAICLSLFYGGYRLLLAKETFHRFKRLALVGLLVLSVLIPLMEFEITLPEEQLCLPVEMEQSYVEMLPTSVIASIDMEQSSSVSFMWWIIIVQLVYLIGIFIFTCRYVYSLIYVGWLIGSGRIERHFQGVTLIVHDKAIAPFSWMRYIVMSRADWETDGREIMLHEMAHIRNFHSIDLLLADLYLLFQWFNPVAWRLKRELQMVHEFEADEAVISGGKIEMKEYQLLLIKKAVDRRLYPVVDNLNNGKLKKRIDMMLKRKSNPWKRWKYLYVFPLAAVAMSAFARPEVSEQMEKLSSVQVSDVLSAIGDRSEETSADIVNGDFIAIGNEVAVKDSLQSQKGNVETFWIRSLNNGKSDSLSSKPLVIINGIEVAGDDPISELDVEDIESFSVLKEKSATQLYGEKGKNGVIFIELKPTSKKFGVGMSKKMMQAKASVAVKKGQSEVSRQGTGEQGDTLLIVDGKVSAVSELAKIDIHRIKSFSIIKDKPAMNMHGKSTVLVFDLFDDEEYKARQEKRKQEKGDIKDISREFSEGKNPLILVDGKKVSWSEYEKIDPDKIRTIVVMKEKEAVSFYGEEGKNGAVLVETKSSKSFRDSQNGVNKSLPEIKSPAPELLKLSQKKRDLESRKAYLNSPKALIIVDGKEAPKDVFQKLDVERIKSVKALKDEDLASYGEKGKNGVVIITTLSDKEYKKRKEKQRKESSAI